MGERWLSDAGTLTNLKNLLADVIIQPKKPLMFFVGAGISVDSGLPNFCEFSKVILEKIVPTAKNACCPLIVNDENIEQIASALRPEVLLQTIYEIIGDNIFQFYDWLTSGKPNLYHYYLAAAIYRGHYVFTCNVDNLIEKAYKYLYPDGKLRVCVDGESDYTKISDTDLHDNIGNVGILFKVHGSIEPEQQNQYRSIRFTLNQVGKGIPANIKKVLEKALKKYDCIFLGYSGCDHFSNQPVFNTTITSKKSYWLWWEGGQSVRQIDAKQFFADKQNKIDTHLKNGNPFFTFRRALEIKSVGEYFHQKEYKSEISLHSGDIGLLLMTLFPILKQQSNEFTNIDNFIRVLARKGHSGNTSRLTAKQIAELKDIIKKVAKAYDFQNERWDSKRIAKVIKEKFNVIYNSNYVCELLKHHGLSCQKPGSYPKIIV